MLRYYSTSSNIKFLNNSILLLENSVSCGEKKDLYNIACAYSLLNDKEKCIYFLEKTHAANVLPSSDYIMADKDLVNVHGTSEFECFIKKVTEQTENNVKSNSLSPHHNDENGTQFSAEPEDDIPNDVFKLPQ